MRRPNLSTLSVGKSRLKIGVMVLPTQKDMLVTIRRDNARGREPGVANNTIAYCNTSKSVIGRHAAVVYFCKPHLSVGVVAHEMTHAAFAVLARRKVKSIECSTEEPAEHEEELCYLVQDLTDQFYKRFGIK